MEVALPDKSVSVVISVSTLIVVRVDQISGYGNASHFESVVKTRRVLLALQETG
jgi:hypothetical protein